MRVYGTLEERFWARVDKDGPNGCWVWLGAVRRSGYGHIHINGLTKDVHRVAYSLLVGPIPAGLHIDHICHNKACVNPDHLRLCTRFENHHNTLRPKHNTSGFKGASRHKGRWHAQIQVNGKVIYLGSFKTPEAAHEAYCKAAERLHGVFANFG